MSEGPENESDGRLEARESREFRVGLAISAGPILVLSLLSTGGVVLDGLYVVWFGALLYGVLAWIVGLIKGARRTTFGKGMAVGIWLGLLGLGTSCFANLATVDLA